MTTAEPSPIPVPFDDAVILIRVRAKTVTAAGIHVPESKQDNERRVGRVVAVGPGKVVAGSAPRLSTVARIDGESESAESDPSPRRLPMNVEPGMYVIFTNGVLITPYGPATQEYTVTRNEYIACSLPGFQEDETVDAPERGSTVPGLLVPSTVGVPKQLVDPKTGAPFRPKGSGRA